ncbi:MAG: hypothetical protein F2534_15100 [Actinobacteria bacterium]|nr:hypothetical protein [Actinomycetota bacterium]
MSGLVAFGRWAVRPAEEVVHEAAVLAAAVVERLGFDPLHDRGEPDRVAQTLDLAAFELAVLVDFDTGRLGETGGRWSGEAGLAEMLVWLAAQHCRREPDEVRAGRLLELVAAGMPPDPLAFAARHVDRALELNAGRLPGVTDALRRFRIIARALS